MKLKSKAYNNLEPSEKPWGGRFVRPARMTVQPRRRADKERRKRTESALQRLAAEAHFFYGSLADVVKEAYQTDTDENAYLTDRGETGNLLTNVNAAIRTSLIQEFDQSRSEFVRVLKPTDTHGAPVPWVIYLRPEFRKSRAGSSDLDRENWFDQIRAIAGAVSIERKRYTSKYIELFETYMLLYMHNRGPSVFCSIAEMRRRKICSAIGWFPDYAKAPWKKNRGAIVERLENNSYLAAIALDPGNAWHRLKELERDAGRDLPRVYLRQGGFEEQITRAPEMPYRQDVLQRIDKFVRKPETGQLLSLSGGPGTGKTALISGYLAQEFRQGRRHPCFFVEMGKQQPATILGVLATKIRPSLISRTGFYGPESNESALALLNEALETVSRRYPRVIFIDGLDETEPAPLGESLCALLAQVRFPKHIRLVLSGRPTEDFRRLLTARGRSEFNVELKVSDAQNAALRAYYEDHLGKKTARSVRLDLLVHKSEGSFLYAELAVPEIKQALTDHGYYDVRKAPQGLDLQIQREWRRLCRGPLSRTQLTRLIACAAVHKAWPTLEELADFSGLDFPDIEAFFAAHEHLFVLDRSATPFLDPGTRLIGFCNSEVRRFLVDKKILPQGTRRANTCILDHYYQEGKPGWQTRLDDYSLQHLIEHAKLSSKPTSTLRILCREFVEKKRHIGVTTGALVVDTEAALEVAANIRDLSSLLKFGLLRGRLVERDTRPVSARFPFLQIDEDETALADARSLGNPDDHLLTLAELILRRSSAQEESADLLSEMETHAAGCSPEITEYVALRVAAVAPDTALELANAIPEPAFLDDLPGSCERPTRTRCLWSLAQVTAETDEETGRRFMEQVEKRGTKFDSFICWVALAVSLFRRSVPQAIAALRSVHSVVENEQERTVSGFLFVKWLLWHVPDINLEESLEVLRNLSGFIPIQAWRYNLCNIFDMKFNEQPAFWIAAAKGLPDGWSKDFIVWRLTSLGHLPPPELELIQDPIIRDIMRADACIEGAERQSDAAFGAGCQIETRLGNCRAIAGVAGLLIKENPVRALQVVRCFLESDQLVRDWDGFSGALEVLTAIIDTTCEARRSVLTWCLDTMNALRPELDRPTAAAMVGNVLRAGLIKEPRRGQPAFFREILADLKNEPLRRDAAEFLIQELTVDECMVLAERRQEFDIGTTARACTENAEELLLPESKVGLLLLLSGRVRRASEEGAKGLILEAAGLCTQISDRVDREDHASEVLEWAMRLRPTLFWEAYDLCPVDAVRITGAIMDVLAEQRECSDLRDTYLRLELERFLDPHDEEEGPGSIPFAVKRLAMLASKGFHRRHACDLGQDPPSSSWLQDLAQFVSLYVGRFKKDRVTLPYPHTDFIVKAIAELNWEAFMEIARREDVGPMCVGDMSLDHLRRALIQANVPDGRLLEDVEYVAHLESPLYRRRNGLGRFTRALVAALAAHYPEGCLQTLRRLPKQTRCQFALNALGLFSSSTRWSRQRTLALFQLMEESETPDETVQAKASFLEWLSASQDVSSALWKGIYEQAGANTNPVVLAELAKHMSRWNAELASRLLDRAIQRCEEGRDMHDALTVLELHKDIDIAIRRRILNRLATIDRPGMEHQVEKVALLQAEVDPVSAIETVSRTEEGQLDVNKVIAAVAQHVKITCEPELEDWCKRVEADQSLEGESKQHFRERALWRCIEEGSISTTDSIRKVLDFHERLRLLIHFAESTACPKKRDLLEVKLPPFFGQWLSKDWLG